MRNKFGRFAKFTSSKFIHEYINLEQNILIVNRAKIISPNKKLLVNF